MTRDISDQCVSTSMSCTSVITSIIGRQLLIAMYSGHSCLVHPYDPTKILHNASRQVNYVRVLAKSVQNLRLAYQYKSVRRVLHLIDYLQNQRRKLLSIVISALIFRITTSVFNVLLIYL